MEKSLDEKCQEACSPEKEINKGPAGTGAQPDACDCDSVHCILRRVLFNYGFKLDH